MTMSGPKTAQMLLCSALACAALPAHAVESSRMDFGRLTDGTSVEVAGHGATDDALRALVSACWHVGDGSGRSVDPAAVRRAWRSAETSASEATVGSHRVRDRQEGVQ